MPTPVPKSVPPDAARPIDAPVDHVHGSPEGAGWRATGLPQIARLLACAVAIGSDWIWLSLTAGRTAVTRREAFERRAAARLVATLGILKGPFAKLGQFAALRLDLLSPTLSDALGTLRDRVPPLPPERIRVAVERELGAPIAVLFSEFSTEPLGAASIAQVHHALLRDGTEVAVKVQYPWLAGSLAADLLLVRAVLALFLRGRGGAVDRGRLLAEFEAGLREELDFEREARMAAEIAENLVDDDQVMVPTVYRHVSSRRVLTVEYRPAIGLTDRAGLARRGIEPRAVLEVLARAYAAQLFVHGLFHADPHPGNLFVVDEPGASQRPRLLFVDFGLSRRLAPELRDEMRRGIYALIQRDLDGFLGGMDRLGMIAPGAHEGVRRAVASMFDRIGQSGGPLGAGGSAVLSLKDQAKVLLHETPGLQLPNDLLLYARTLSTVFALGSELDPDVDMMKLTLPSLLRFLSAPAAD